MSTESTGNTEEQLFPGFVAPDENWSKLPHEFIAMLPQIESLAEIKVVLYVLRHTWGYREYDEGKVITIDEFMKGRKRADKSRLDPGTGLSKQSVVTGVKLAVQHGFLRVATDDSDLARKERRYALRMSNSLTSDVNNLDIRGTESRHRTEKDNHRKRTQKEGTADEPPSDNPLAPFKQAIAEAFYDGVIGGSQFNRALFGYKKTGLVGIVERERVRHGGSDPNWMALALLVPQFQSDYENGEQRELRDPDKLIGRWQGWRNRMAERRKPPRLTYDPNCPLGCDKGMVEDDQGRAGYCECRKRILAEMGQ